MKTLSNYILVFCCLFSPFCQAQNWQTVSEELGEYRAVYTLYADTVENGLYVGGDFENIGNNTNMRSIALWKEGQWHALANGLNSYQFAASIRDIVQYNGEIYVCGVLTDANGLTCNGIAKWNGSQWSSVGEGLLDYDGNPAFTFNLRVIEGELYACGQIFSAGNITANGIAKWNGTSWSSVHDFPFFDEEGDVINDCIIYNGELYVCGSFYAGSGTGMLGIAKWNGSDWVGVGPMGVGQAACMEVYEDKLYVGGYFSSMMNPALPGNYIASWDGSNWDNVGGGVGNSNGNVYEMMVHDGLLYVAGAFTSVGGIAASFIATWDGHEWCDLGSTSDNGISAIEEFHDTLYIGGAFTELNGNPIFSVAKSGGPAQNENCGTLASIEDIDNQTNSLFTVYPNPTKDEVTLIFQSQNPEKVTLTLIDVMGRKLEQIEIAPFSGKYEHVLSLSNYPNGVYILQATSGNRTYASRIIKQR